MATTLPRTNLTALTADDGSYLTGTVWDKATINSVCFAPVDAALANTSGITFGGPVFTRNRTIAEGKWTAHPFNAADYSGASAMTWTVDAAAVVGNRYAVVGDVLFWRLYIAWFAGTSTVGGTPSGSLLIAAPGGFTLAASGIHSTRAPYAIDGGAFADCYVTQSGNNLAINKISGANWTAGAVGFVGTYVFELA